MFLPFILFVTLTVATAVIAHWSDNLGKKLGKKRVSLFGLRPRTTATVLTITSSWGIMLFTLVFLLVAVAPLRRALLYYERDREQYRKDIGQAKGQLMATQNLLTEKQSSLSSTQGQLEKVRLSLTKANEDARKARKDAAKAVAEGKKRVAEAQMRVVSAQAKFVEAQSRVTQALRQEGVARKGERQAEGLARQAHTQLIEARSSLERTNANLREAKQNLATASTSLFKATTTAFQTAKDVLKLENQRNQLVRQLDFYGNIAEQLGGGEVSIPVGRTFAAGIIESGKSEKRIEENLRQLFAKGRAALPVLESTKGATLELLPLPEIVKGKIVLLKGDAIFERLAQTIVKNDDATSVRLIAVRNFTAGETAIDARFVAVPVATAFHAGEEIASTSIDGNSGDAGVFHELTLLTDEGRDVAVRRKVNPPLSPQEPNFYAAGTNVALFAAMRRIEATGKVVNVKLVAADDLLTVERLRVRFEVEGDELED